MVMIAQLVLAVLIAVLGYFLYRSVTEPYKLVEQQEQLTELTRSRMGQIRSALRYYEEKSDRFPHTLDSLLMYIEADSLMAIHGDSLLGGPLLDSLLYTPRGGNMFEYTVNDTSRVIIYQLKDPASGDVIGTMEPDITQLHAANWE